MPSFCFTSHKQTEQIEKKRRKVFAQGKTDQTKRRGRKSCTHGERQNKQTENGIGGLGWHPPLLYKKMCPLLDSLRLHYFIVLSKRKGGGIYSERIIYIDIVSYKYAKITKFAKSCQTRNLRFLYLTQRGTVDLRWALMVVLTKLTTNIKWLNVFQLNIFICPSVRTNKLKIRSRFNRLTAHWLKAR